jgi:hypothetical protein
MTAPIRLNLKVYQGNTFRQVLRWESNTKVYSNIVQIEQSAPVAVTSNDTEIPVGWRAKIYNVRGMKEINSTDAYNLVTGRSPSAANTIYFNGINALAYTPYTGGGILEYNKPVDLGAYTASMRIRDRTDPTTVLYTLTTANGGITFDNTAKTITILIPSNITSNFTFSSAIYSLTFTKNGETITFANGSISLITETGV